MNELERRAWTHAIAKSKAEMARNAESTSEEMRRELPDYYSKHFSTDPEVLGLIEDGWEAFLERVATRILRDHGSEIYMNRCPKCGEVTVTPKARQCRYCRHDWHT